MASVNNAEVTAVLEAFKALKKRCCVSVYTDSAFVVRMLTASDTKWNRKFSEELAVYKKQHEFVIVQQIARNENTEADALCRRALRDGPGEERYG